MNCNNITEMEEASGELNQTPGMSSGRGVDVSNSNLTALAKEFFPSTSGGQELSFCNDTGAQGAIKKKKYSNQKYFRSDDSYNNGKQFKNKVLNYDNESQGSSSNRNFYNTNHRTYYNSNRNFSKSSEQSKILQETKKFLEEVKHRKNSEDGSSSKAIIAEGSLQKEEDYVDQRNLDSSNKYYKSKRKQNPSSGYKSYQQKYNVKNDYSKPFNLKKENDTFQKDNGQIKSQYRKYEEKKNFSVDHSDFRKSGFHNLKKKLDAASQRERLEELVVRRLLECLVCCEKLRHTEQVWSCKQCYHILHLQCIKRWAQSSKLEAGWRCPACQNVYQDVPKNYYCYCNKQSNPLLDPGGIPHSCGNVCRRKGRSCSHTCTLVCHPGPCPDCTIMVVRSCGCGATKPTVKCSSMVPVTCPKICNKTLTCGLHKCDRKCHEGVCDDCTAAVLQECYCRKQGRKVKCTAEISGSTVYACGDICDKLLSCGNHKCELNCHPGLCNPCALAPEVITTCNCGQIILSKLRESCLDPIPCCDMTCNRKLLCGQPSAPHLCSFRCHEGPCPPCSRTTTMRCRCGHMDKEIPCAQVTTKADDARCEKKCAKKRLCGKHKCNQMCCIEVDHICPLPCNRLLSCGQHRCDQSCHKGRCLPCWRTSFEELYCECGVSVLYPPVACGTRPPPCDQPCSKQRACGHDANHSCHTGICPPCTVLCKRWCHGQHEQRSAIPCHQENFSCGLPCGKKIPCGRHKCIQSCHEGPCRTPCTQPCTEIRADCSHPCNQPCHEPPCPEGSCKQMVKVTCQCGLRKSSRICNELSGEYQNITMAHLASKMEQMQIGQTVDITDIISGQKKGTLKTLECNDECRLVERNRRLAIGLQIRNPDLSAKLTPKYSDYMRSWAKKDPKFCKHVHDKLTELVQLAKQSKQKSRSYSFESMNRDKRHFAHEYCEHFGCDSAAYDPEPNRNVVATAFKDKSWLPSYSLLEIIQRENGLRKVPGPQQLGKISSSKAETLPLKSEAVSLKIPGRLLRPATPPGEYVDYFNDPPEQ